MRLISDTEDEVFLEVGQDTNRCLNGQSQMLLMRGSQPLSENGLPHWMCIVTGQVCAFQITYLFSDCSSGAKNMGHAF